MTCTRGGGERGARRPAPDSALLLLCSRRRLRAFLFFTLGLRFLRLVFLFLTARLRRLRPQDHPLALGTGEEAFFRSLLPIVGRIVGLNSRAASHDHDDQHQDRRPPNSSAMLVAHIRQNFTLAPTVPTFMFSTLGATSRLSEYRRYCK